MRHGAIGIALLFRATCFAGHSIPVAMAALLHGATTRTLDAFVNRCVVVRRRVVGSFDRDDATRVVVQVDADGPISRLDFGR